MALKTGTKAPDFSLINQDGQNINLEKDLKGRHFILLFYPKDFTAGCTMELCQFRDSYNWFVERGIEIMAISHDSVSSHREFGGRYQLPFQLLSDPGRRVAKLYDAVFPFSVLTKRVSYFIDSEGFIQTQLDSMMNIDKHLSQMKSFVMAQYPELVSKEK